MTEEFKPRPAAGYVHYEAGTGMARNADACMSVHGVHFCTAGNFEIGSGDAYLYLLFWRASNGLYMALTPDGARETARMLNEAADLVEARGAPKANAQLAATLAKGKGAA